MALAHWARKIVFKKLNISETFSEIPDSTRVHALWKKLLDVNNLLSIHPENITNVKISEFQSESKEFVRMFTEIYPAKHVTPYMHALHDATCRSVHDAKWCYSAFYTAGT